MRLLVSLIAASLAGGLIIGSNVAANAANTMIYEIENWPDNVGKACQAWIKRPDGSWMQVAPIVVGSPDGGPKRTMSENIFAPSSSGANALNASCSQ